MSLSAGAFNRFLITLRRRPWLLVAPMVLIAGATALASSFVQARYYSAGVVDIEPSRVSELYSRAGQLSSTGTRWDVIRNEALSRTRLQRIITDLDLYELERQTGSMEEAVEQMRRDVQLTAAEPPGTSFTVGFTAADPHVARRVAERLTATVIDNATRDRQVLLEGSKQFLDARLEDVRGRLVEAEAEMASQPARAHSRAAALEFEVLQEAYRQLLLDSENLTALIAIERRQIGEQFQLLEAARVPERPSGASRLQVNLAGVLAGLGLGLVLVAGATRKRGARAD